MAMEPKTNRSKNMNKQDVIKATQYLAQPLDARVVSGEHAGRVGTVLRESATHYGVVLGPEATWALIRKDDVHAA